MAMQLVTLTVFAQQIVATERFFVMRDILACGVTGSGLGTIITFGMAYGLVAVVIGTVIMAVGCCLTEEV